MRKVAKLNIDGTVETLDLDAPTGSLGVLQTAVDGMIDIIRIDPKVDMYINDEGKYTQEINHYATALFQTTFNTRDYISGAVVFTGGVDDEGEDKALPEDMFEVIRSFKARVEAANPSLHDGQVEMPPE